MADSTVTGFPAGTALTGSEYFGCDQAGATNRVTANMLRTFVLTTPSITGNLAVTGSITGGSINSTPIGATTPSTGAFTSLSASGSAQIGNSATLTWGAPYGAGVTTIQGTGSAFNIYPTGASNGVVGAFNSQGLTLATGVNVSWGGVYGAGIPTIVGGSSGLYFYPAGSTSGATLTATSSGHLLIGTTTDDGVNALQVNGAAKATSIKFANTGGTKQALDYYEEGTWTPAQAAGTTVVGTFVSGGTYTRIGRQVTVVGYIGGTTSIAWTAGAAVSGLPFFVSVSGYGYPCGSVSNANFTSSNTCVGYVNGVYFSLAASPAGSYSFTLTYFI